MRSLWTFRVLVLLIAVAVAGLSVANLVAEILRPDLPSFPSILSRVPSPQQVSAAKLSSTIAPFRSDLKADYALVLAEQILSSQSGQSPNELETQTTTQDALAMRPPDSRLWLVLALLQSRSKPTSSRVTEALKMSYLTGPNRPEIIPIRLQTVTAGDFLNDPDLSELAKGDVRAMLSQRPEQRFTLVNDYLRGSEVGKAFLEKNVTTIDPGFVDVMRGAKNVN